MLYGDSLQTFACGGVSAASFPLSRIRKRPKRFITCVYPTHAASRFVSAWQFSIESSRCSPAPFKNSVRTLSADVLNCRCNQRLRTHTCNRACVDASYVIETPPPPPNPSSQFLLLPLSLSAATAALLCLWRINPPLRLLLTSHSVSLTQTHAHVLRQVSRVSVFIFIFLFFAAPEL